jgi:hypothetical protein
VIWLLTVYGVNRIKFYKFLERKRRCTLRTNPDVRDSDVHDYYVRDIFIGPT